MKKYKAIFFDWDGTAVLSREADAAKVISCMKKLLQNQIKLVIVSGTTYDKICSGKLHTYFSKEELLNLYMGLGRGAYNYKFNENKEPYLWKNLVPEKDILLKIHNAAFEIHNFLLKEYNYPTDIVFSRPNYCKIDMMAYVDRGENLFFHENELEELKGNLKAHGYHKGMKELLDEIEEVSRKTGITLKATTDAKYLEIGLSTKSDNVDTILSYFSEKYDIKEEECSYWGDEFIELDDNVFGSDSYMMTEKSKKGDFYDVSDAKGKRPKNVEVLNGGVEAFLNFLTYQGK